MQHIGKAAFAKAAQMTKIRQTRPKPVKKRKGKLRSTLLRNGSLPVHAQVQLQQMQEALLKMAVVGGQVNDGFVHVVQALQTHHHERRQHYQREELQRLARMRAERRERAALQTRQRRNRRRNARDSLRRQQSAQDQ